MTHTHPAPAGGRTVGPASTSEAPGPVADVSGIAWSEHVVVDLGQDWAAVRALARFVGCLIAGAVVGELLAGPAGGLAGAMTAFTTYVLTATAVTTLRTRSANRSQR